MISLKELRKIDPQNTANLTDEELEGIRASFYEVGQLIFEDWYQQKFGFKSPIRSLTEEEDRNKI